MAEEITNATEMVEGEEIRSATKKRFFDVSFKLKVLSWPFLINIAFALEFYSPSLSICSFPVPETYCIRGKHSRKYGSRIKKGEEQKTVQNLFCCKIRKCIKRCIEVRITSEYTK